MSFKNEFQIRNLWTKFFWHIALSYKVCFLLMISSVASLRVKIFSNRLDFYSDVCSLLLISSYTRTSKNSIFVFEYLKSNFIVLCFWFSSLKFVSATFVLVYI